MNKKILWLELHEENLMELERSILPMGFDLIRPVSASNQEEHLRLLADADYLITGSIPVPRNYIMAAPRLKLIHKWGVGVEKIDLEAAKKRSIPVYITAGANAVPVAELAVGLILAVNRMIPYMDRTIREGYWVRKAMRAQCHLLHNKRVGLIGMGNIARQVAKRIVGFQAEIVYYDIFPLDEATEREYGAQRVELEELLYTSDVVSIHAPLTDQTRGMIGARELSLMKPTAILINTARGLIVVENALAEALKSRQIRGAGLDAYETEPLCTESPLRQLDNVVLTCHVGGAVVENVLTRTQRVYENILSFTGSGKPVDVKDIWQQ